jgi:hypothetical protein
MTIEGHAVELLPARDALEELDEEVEEAAALLGGLAHPLGLHQIDVADPIERRHEGIEPLVVVGAEELVPDRPEVSEEVAHELEARLTGPAIVAVVLPLAHRIDLREERADDLLEHPDLPAQAIARDPARRGIGAELGEPRARPGLVTERADPVLDRGAELRARDHHLRSELLRGHVGPGRRQVMLEDLLHLDAERGREALEAGAHPGQAPGHLREGHVAHLDLVGGNAEDLPLEAVGHRVGSAAREVAGQRAEIAAKHREDHVCAPCRGDVGRVLIDDADVAERAEEGQERHHRDPVRCLGLDRVQRFEHLGAPDPIELRSELERHQRIEVRVPRDLAEHHAVHREVEAVRGAWCPEQTVDEIDQVSEGVPEEEERLLRSVLGELLLHQAAARRVLGENRLEISRERVGALLVTEELLGERDHPLRGVAEDSQLLVEVLGDRRPGGRRTGVVPRIAEAGDPLEEHLELEERLLLALPGERDEPRIARGRLLATEPAGVAQQVRVDVALVAEHRDRRHARAGYRETDRALGVRERAPSPGGSLIRVGRRCRARSGPSPRS